MGELEFCVEVALRGSVLGVGVTDAPEDVARVLGPDFLAIRDRATLRYDYGLVEFFWHRAPVVGWVPAGFVVQVHRLAKVEICAELTRRFGRFEKRLPFALLDAELRSSGYPLTELPRAADAGHRHWLQESRVVVASEIADQAINADEVWSISAPHPLADVADLGPQRAAKDRLTHLLDLHDDGRRLWLDRRQSAAEEPAWWRQLLRVANQLLGHEPARRPEVVELKLWLLGQAQSRGVFTRAEYAQCLADFVAEMRRQGVVGSGLLPAADEIARTCLDAIPVAVDRVLVLDDQQDIRELDRAQVRASRQAKALVGAAQWHLGEVRDQGLADRLRTWIDVKTRLV